MFYTKLKENHFNSFKPYYSPLRIYGQRSLENVICINIHRHMNGKLQKQI